MTQTNSAPARRAATPDRTSRGTARLLARGAAGAILGGGLLGCAAVVFALAKAPAAPAPAPPLPPAEASARRPPALRVVAAPDHRRFDARKAAAAVPRPAHRATTPPLLSAGALLPRLDLAALAAPSSAPARAVRSHRFDAAEAGALAAFRPAAPEPAMLEAKAPEATALAVAEEIAPAAERRVAALLPSKALPAPARIAERERPTLVAEDHVETALPDLPGTAEAESAPNGAAAALERELALAVPMPTARPFRKPAVADEPDLRHRNRAPAGLLAYARPDAGALDAEPAIRLRSTPSTPSTPSPSAGTAIYDISAATVYLPNGERLEAHSGLGAMRDNVRYVKEKNRGPTPPHTYNLAMRESLFHGVAAIRLHPVGGERNIHNRVGLLAHTYMLGPKGDSNGCVSFKDYKRFLAAFKRGEIKRLVVVPSYKPTSRLASLFGLGGR